MRYFATIFLSILLSAFSLIAIADAAKFNKVVWFTTPNPSMPEEVMESININVGIKPVGENNYVLDDTLCKNGKFSIQSNNLTGEWVTLGGNLNTPPIYFVENLTNYVNLITSQGGWGGYINYKLYNGYVDPGTGIPVYIIFPHMRFYPAFGTVVCELVPKTNTVQGANQVSDNSFVVTSSDIVNIYIEDDVKCIFFRFANTDSYRGTFIRRGVFYNNWNNLVGSINFSKSFEVKDPQPKIEASSAALNSQFAYGKPSYVTITLKNVGENDFNITDVKLNVLSDLISVYPTHLSSGESAEVVFSVTPTESTDLDVNLKYNFNQCGTRELETKSIPVGTLDVKPPACKSDANCGSGFTCCLGTCYKKTNGECKDINGDGIPDWVPYGSEGI